MKIVIALCIVNLIFTKMVNAENSIALPHQNTTKVNWTGGETHFFAEDWGVEVVGNISKPTLTIFPPSNGMANGKAVVIAPGGALYFNSIQSEGEEVARWLTERGYLAAILKYRLVPTTDKSTEELARDSLNKIEFYEKVNQVMPLSIKDGLEAIMYLKSNHKKYNINADSVGILGFSAGGAVTMGVAYNYVEHNRPDFVVAIYPWTDFMPIRTPLKDAPPLLLICASDDELGLAPGSINLYNSWHQNGLSAELHMFAKGGHGFGMRKNGNVSDHWIERFDDWANAL